MAREELSLDFFHQSHWCETPLMKTSAAQGNLGAVLRRNSYCKWWSQNFSETILFWTSDNEIKWLPFLDHRWMLLWAHSPLHRWECWSPPGAWHSKHSAAFWEIERCTGWQDKSDRMTRCLCKLSHLNTTLPLQSLISMWIFVGKWRESPAKWIFSFNFSVLELKELVNLNCVK